MQIIKGKTILHNTVTDYVFLAGEVDENTQLSADSHKHIKPIGELSVAINEPYNPSPDIKERDGNTFTKELETLINRYSKENGSNTPDFILAEYLNDCIIHFNKAVMRRSEWYGFVDRIGYAAEEKPKLIK